MREFIDETLDREGTPFSRRNAMAMQGFVGSTTSFQEDGSVVCTNEFGETLTVRFLDDGSIQEIYSGEKTITKTTRFVDGNITEVLS